MADYNYALGEVGSTVVNSLSGTSFISNPILMTDGSKPPEGGTIVYNTGKYNDVLVSQGVYANYVKRSPAFDVDFYLSFSEPITRLNELKIYFANDTNHGDDGGINYSLLCPRKLYLKQNDAYTLVSSASGSYVGLQLWDITFNPAKKEVQGIKINASQSYISRSYFRMSFYIVEIEAMGVLYEDVKFRYYDGSAVKAVGVNKHLGSDHKLRIYDGSNTRGIDLVSTSRDDASKIRMYDGLAVKALPSIDIS